MSLCVIFGPMKSGKSLELIAQISPYNYTKQKVVMIQPKRNVRDDKIMSRAGVALEAVKVSSLNEVQAQAHVIGIDEIHMFDIESISKIKEWILEDRTIFVSGLDTDYKGHMIPVVKLLYELQPDLVIRKKSVCDFCSDYNAYFSAIYKGDKRITDGLPPVVPDDGTYHYKVACRRCFYS